MHGVQQEQLAGKLSRIAAAKQYLEALCDIYLDLLLLRPLEDFIEHDVCNLLDLSLSELSEDNDLIQPAAGSVCENGYTKLPGNCRPMNNMDCTLYYTQLTTHTFAAF